MNADVIAKSTHIFKVNNIRKNRNWGRSWSQGRDAYEPDITIPDELTFDEFGNVES